MFSQHRRLAVALAAWAGLCMLVASSPSGHASQRAGQQTKPDAAPSTKDKGQPAAERGINWRKANTPEPSGKRWALIVGINYDKHSPNSEAPPLRNAETDARELAKMLQANFGYDSAQIIMLLGSATDMDKLASKRNVFFAIDDRLARQVQADDSVLFFFAGHGRVRPKEVGEKKIGDLVPVNSLDEQGRLIDSELIRIDELVTHLKELPARQRLIVLDCCQSGQLFNLPIANEVLTDQADKQAAKESFWGIASCMSWEFAADGKEKHSPFTASLLANLDLLSGSRGTNWFTAKELLHSIQDEFQTGQRYRQRPVGGPLVVRSGQFYFQANFQESWPRITEMTDELAKTLPGARADWWFDEMPWLIPAARNDIVKTLKARSANLSAIEKKELAFAARRWLKDAEDAMATAEAQIESAEQPLVWSSLKVPLDVRRKMQVKQLLDVEERNRVAAFRKLAQLLHPLDRLSELTGKVPDAESKADPGLSPLQLAYDRHLAALLHHRLEKLQPGQAGKDHEANDPPKAGSKPADEPTAQKHSSAVDVRKLYATALYHYRKAAGKGQMSTLAMHALCHCDAGYYHLRRAEVADAIEHFESARSLFRASDKTIPVHFDVHLLCREAEAYSTLSNWSEVFVRLRRAEEKAKAIETNGPLTAFVYESSAWAKLTSWQLADAKEYFEKAAKIRADLAGQDTLKDIDSTILKLHNSHGLAICARYTGSPGEAIRTYQQLLEIIQQTIDNYERGENHSVYDYRIERERLYERLLNTTERLGDCLLFDPAYAQPAEAARFYAQASTLRHNLPLDQADLTRLRLWYKLAICHSDSTNLRDQASALEMIRAAEEDLQRCLKAGIVSPEQGKSLEFYRVVSFALTLLANTQAATEAMEKMLTHPEVRSLRQLLEQSLERSNAKCDQIKCAWTAEAALTSWIEKQLTTRQLRVTLQRDQIDTLLFACRMLLKKGQANAEQSPVGPNQPHPCERPCSLLNRLCTLVRESNPVEPLAFLRPTYELVVRTQIACKRADVKSLLDLTHTARTGRQFRKVVDRPTLAFFFYRDGHGIALLDTPTAAGKIYPIYDQPNDALADRRPIRLPRELVTELSRHAQVQVLWQDRVAHGQGEQKLTLTRELFEFPARHPELARTDFDLLSSEPPTHLANAND